MTLWPDKPGPAAAALGVALAVLAASLFITSRLLAAAGDRLQRTGDETARLRSELAALERDLPLADAGRALHRRLTGRGVLSPADRDRLLQETADAVISRSLPAPRLRFADTGPTRRSVPAASGLALEASTMHVGLELGHELDLFAITDALTATAGGLIHVRNCHLTGPPGDAAGSGGAALHADCQIDWLNIAPRGKP